jgi:hypothetical protein
MSGSGSIAINTQRFNNKIASYHYNHFTYSEYGLFLEYSYLPCSQKNLCLQIKSSIVKIRSHDSVMHPFTTLL